MKKYVLGIDQSTQGTKALLFDQDGNLTGRADVSHAQLINEKGWVEHDLREIYRNMVLAVNKVIEKTGINPLWIQALGISNQRETGAVWDRKTGEPLWNAIVWQCSRAEEICKRMEQQDPGLKKRIKKITGLHFSPYFTAAKFTWLMEHVPGLQKKAERGEVCFGTIDSWLVYCLTKGERFQTDMSNASRTQLFDIYQLKWDEDLCRSFGIPVNCLPKVTDSNGDYGRTDLEGLLPEKVPICSVLGDSHGALYGQKCHEKGMIKATYGTGSSVMMNIGEHPVEGENVVTSLAWSIDGRAEYVLEGNINYTGAVITWLKDNLQLIQNPEETKELALGANPLDRTYLVPAFTGLGAPYWNSRARACICGMSRTTGKKEVVKAALESIGYQIADLVFEMEKVAEVPVKVLKADGGPTANDYLMQFQSDVLQIPVQKAAVSELSGAGTAYLAGISCGIYEKQAIFSEKKAVVYNPAADRKAMEDRYQGWKQAVLQVNT